MSGKQLRLFLVDGTPGGLTTAEIMNWVGHVLTGPRSQLAELLRRAEVSRTGVYILLGDDEDAIGGTRCYIGESDDVADRLRSHERQKEFWDRVVVVTSKDFNITKAHARYLEARLIGLAEQAGRASVENNTAPALPSLPEADASDMEEFLSNLHIVLPVLGVNAIRARTLRRQAGVIAQPSESPIFHLRYPKTGIDARAQQIDGEFTMLVGSVVVASWHGVGNAESTKKSYASYRARHEQLVTEGAIIVEGGTARLARDVVFSSPSTAGAVATGRSCNGRVEWVSEDGRPFGVWESRGVESEDVQS